jgi:hypothetical protein
MTDREMTREMLADPDLYLFYRRSKISGETPRQFVAANRETVEAIIKARRASCAL